MLVGCVLTAVAESARDSSSGAVGTDKEILLLCHLNSSRNRSKRSFAQQRAKFLKRPFSTVFVWKRVRKLHPVLKKVATFSAAHLFISFENLDAVKATDTWRCQQRYKGYQMFYVDLLLLSL